MRMRGTKAVNTHTHVNLSLLWRETVWEAFFMQTCAMRTPHPDSLVIIEYRSVYTI